jgi:hypothetical protein
MKTVRFDVDHHRWCDKLVYIVYEYETYVGDLTPVVRTPMYVEMNRVPEALRHLMIPMEEIRIATQTHEESKPRIGVADKLDETTIIAMFRSRYDAERVAACLVVLDNSDRRL